MTEVFKDASLDSNKKLIMLALADNANDEGFCYPSINTICIKTSLSKPTVIKHIKQLEELNLLLSKKRTRSNGSATSKIYVIYPAQNLEKLDEEISKKFDQSKEALPPPQSKEALPPKGGQSKAALPLESSLSLFNHHLYIGLDKNEKDLFLEYLSFRKSIKLTTTLKIQERLLNKYYGFGRNIAVIENAISGNWKDFYDVKKQHVNNTDKTEHMVDMVVGQNVDPFALLEAEGNNKQGIIDA